MSVGTGEDWGIYLHVPFCSAVCHYCDFAKTANHDPGLRTSYLEALKRHLEASLRLVDDSELKLGTCRSLFLGGGTPSVFAREYEAIFALAGQRLAPIPEITLEANPEDLTASNLATWKALGVNRLSLGVQTFETKGLRFLTREHTPEGASSAIESALGVFDDVSVDLIYGWPGQTEEAWLRDLERLVVLGVPHVSCYTLTYEARTPIGRRAARGMIEPASEDALARLYDLARERLEEAGFVQEEVSNWAKPGYECVHNALYWQDRPYLAVGAGAHGYLPIGPFGLRYAYGRSERAFVKAPPPGRFADPAAGIATDEGRGAEEWLLEYAGSALRTRAGFSLERVKSKTGRNFRPSPRLADALLRGAASIDDGTLRLTPEEWYRESAWALEVFESFPT